MPVDNRFSRRHFLAAASLSSGSLLVPECFAEEKPARPKVAAVYTVFTHRSHAHVILEKFLPGEDPQLLTPTTELIRSGILDSLATLELVGFLEERFDIQLEAHELGGKLNSLAEIERLVTGKLSRA